MDRSGLEKAEVRQRQLVRSSYLQLRYALSFMIPASRYGAIGSTMNVLFGYVMKRGIKIPLVIHPLSYTASLSSNLTSLSA